MSSSGAKRQRGQGVRAIPVLERQGTQLGARERACETSQRLVRVLDGDGLVVVVERERRELGPDGATDQHGGERPKIQRRDGEVRDLPARSPCPQELVRRWALEDVDLERGDLLEVGGRQEREGVGAKRREVLLQGDGGLVFGCVLCELARGRGVDEGSPKVDALSGRPWPPQELGCVCVGEGRVLEVQCLKPGPYGVGEQV